MKTGSSAILGMGSPMDTMGSKNHFTQRNREIRIPRLTPTIAAIANAINVR